MFVQTEITPNPNSLKFLPGKAVSPNESFEITNKDQTNNELVRNLLSINGVEGIFLGGDFITINKYDDIEWEEIKHIVISLINDFYSSGKECVIESKFLINSLFVSFFFVISNDSFGDTAFPGKNLSELGFGVTSV